MILGSGDAVYQAWWIEPASTGDASCCAPSASRCPETCWLRPRYSRLRPSWVFNWRNMATLPGPPGGF